jgi:hypothetical protein
MDQSSLNQKKSHEMAESILSPFCHIKFNTNTCCMVCVVDGGRVDCGDVSGVALAAIE